MAQPVGSNGQNIDEVQLIGGTSGVPGGGIITVQGVTADGAYPPTLAPIPLGVQRAHEGRIDTLQDAILGDGNVLNADKALVVAAVAHYFSGTSYSPARTPNIFKPLNAVAVNPEATIWTPAAGKRFRIMGYHLSGSVAGNYVLRDNTAGTIILVVPEAAGGGGVAISFGNGILSAVANNVLTCTGPAASTLSGYVFGTEE